MNAIASVSSRAAFLGRDHQKQVGAKENHRTRVGKEMWKSKGQAESQTKSVYRPSVRSCPELSV
jgi:hypothetical protein